MNFRSVFLSLAFLLVFTTSEAVNATPRVDAVTETRQINADYILHTVSKGETVYSIATAYNIEVHEIYRLNPTAKEGIQIGENLLVPVLKPTPARYIEHVVAAKETLYGVSKTYAITVEDIMVANPGLDESTFRIGTKIRIPIFENRDKVKTTIQVDSPSLAETHTKYIVGKKETLYSISKAWNVSIEEILASNPAIKMNGLKEGMEVYLPIRNLTPNLVGNGAKGVYGVGAKVKIGILLPFLMENGIIDKQKIIEYYEGFLIALNEVKSRGLDAEVFTFDVGSATNTMRLESILETTEAKSLSMIIGGVSQQQIDVISKFSRERGIKYVVPFGVLDNEININPYIYQATNSHTNLYWKIADTFKTLFPGNEYNIVFLSEPDQTGDKADFIDAMKKTLVRSQIPFKNATMTFESPMTFTKNLDSTKKNIIIPTSSSELTLRRVMSLINYADKSTDVRLFGYPEWQIYSSFNKTFHVHNTYIYSMFYYDTKDDKTKMFEADYKKWYGKTLVNSFPKYANLGYDAGIYFLTALKRYGNNFESQFSNMIVPTLQSAMYFEKVGEGGGYVNNGLYFIHYRPDMSVDKIDCNRR